MTESYLTLTSKLESLRTELESDVMLSTTRDQHIRSTLRLGHLDRILKELKDSADNQAVTC